MLRTLLLLFVVVGSYGNHDNQKPPVFLPSTSRVAPIGHLLRKN